MDKAIKVKWVKALRSGRYVQTTGELDTPKIDGTVHHCCLGVLQRICRLPKRNEEERHTELLSKAAQKRAGLTHKQQLKLAVMNDSDGKTFDQIADYIERRL